MHYYYGSVCAVDRARQTHVSACPGLSSCVTPLRYRYAGVILNAGGGTPIYIYIIYVYGNYQIAPKKKKKKNSD